MEMNGSLFDIAFNVVIGPKDGDPARFLSHYTGELSVYGVDDDEPTIAGKVSLFLVFADAADEAGISLLDVLDLDARTEPYSALVDEEYAGNFRAPVLRILKEEEMVMSRDMIILDRLEILPKFRGRGLGLEVMQACLHQFSRGSRIAAIKPFPLQLEGGRERHLADEDEWRSRMNLNAFAPDAPKATARLKKYYSKLGFVGVRGTDLMIRDLCLPDVSLDGAD
jgi:GNAT superfamily N-acetyltransferase